MTADERLYGQEQIDEIDARAYLTPPGSPSADLVDPLVMLEHFECEASECFEMATNDSNCNPPVLTVNSPCQVTMNMNNHQAVAGLDAVAVGVSKMRVCGLPANASELGPSDDPASHDGEMISLSLEAECSASAPETADFMEKESRAVSPSQVDETMTPPSTEQSSVSALSADSSSGSPSMSTMENDTDSEDDIETLWSGIAPWAHDANADDANALLVHACGCCAPLRCHDPQFGELCLPMKWLLRCACWASHNRRWLGSRVATLVASLLSYHSLHCQALEDECNVPLCRQLRGAQ